MTPADVVRMVIGTAGGAGLLIMTTGAPQAATDDPGRASFREHCGDCHLDRGFGTRVLARRTAEGQAMLERREDLDARIVELAVRRGVGSMPQIRRTELGDEELATIVHYLERKP
jgi:mono/diheme cytochrome c family protein